MADDKMKLELLLKGIDQLSGVVKKQSPPLKQLDRDATKTLNSLKKLFNFSPKNNLTNFGKQSTSEIRKVTSEAKKLEKTLKSIGNIKIKSPKIDIPFSDISPKTNAKQGQKELDKIFDKKRKSKSYVDKLANINEKVLEPATQVKNVWKEQIDSLRQYTDETKKLYLAQSKFKLINLSESENKRAFEAVSDVVRKFGTVTQTEGIETLTDLHTALGDLDHAIEALPKAAQYRFSMKMLFGDKFSDSEIEEQIQNAFKFLEVTGKVAKGREEMERSFNVLTQMTNATGGRVTPSEMLLMGRRAGASGRNLSDEGLRNLSAPIQELGGDRTGTSLMSMYQALVGGVMKQSAAAEFNRLGLIDQSKIEFGKAQKIKKILPGANKLGDLMMSDPLSAADMLREAMKKGGINTDNPKEISKELAILFGNRNAQNLMDILINQRSQVTKESNLAANAQGNDKMAEGMDKRLADIKKWENALIDFKANAGAPLIQVFSQLAQSATPFLKFFGDNPEIAKWTMALIVGGKAITGIAQTASALSSGGNFLASFFRSSTNSAQNATNALSDFSSKADGLKSKKISVGVQIASVVGIELLLQLIQWEIGKALQAGEGKDRIKKQSKDNYDLITKAEKEGTTFKQKDFQGSASTAWFTMLNNGLETVLNTKENQKKPFYMQISEAATQTGLYPISKLAGANNPFTTGIGYDADKFSMGKGFKDYAPELKDSRIMVEFLRQLRERVPDANKQNLVKEGLQQQFPDSFATAIRQLSILPQGISDMLNKQSGTTQELLGLQQPITNVATWLNGLQQPTNSTQTGFNNAANAANSFASRVNNLQIKPPTFGTISIPSNNNSGTIGGLFNLSGNKEKGGSVQRGHTYRINEVGQEFFTPSTSGSIVANDVMRRQGGTNSATPNITLSPTMNFDLRGSNHSEAAIERIVNRALVKHLRQIKEELSPDALAEKVSFAARRDSELT